MLNIYIFKLQIEVVKKEAPKLELSRVLLREIAGKAIEDIFVCFSSEEITPYYDQQPVQRS